jgi:integrase
MARELTTGDLLGLGLSPRTAYVYGRVWVRVEALLAERGVDWLTCRAADIGVIATGWPNTHSARSLAEANDRSGNLRAVQDLARHSRPETTAGYTRTTAARLKAVVAMIDYGRGAA